MSLWRSRVCCVNTSAREASDEHRDVADGTTIAYDVYGFGPAVILVGGATQHRAIDRRTTEIAKRENCSIAQA
jgi:hypothetical protein